MVCVCVQKRVLNYACACVCDCSVSGCTYECCCLSMRAQSAMRSVKSAKCLYARIEKTEEDFVGYASKARGLYTSAHGRNESSPRCHGKLLYKFKKTMGFDGFLLTLSGWF